MARLHHPEERLRLQPSLILAMFSITTLAKSTREGPDGPGRKRALMYAEAGQSMLQQSIISQSMDPTMAQAALILAAFEAYPHGNHASHRFANALQNLDTIIQAFQLLALDVNDERASIFIPGQIPLLANDSDDVLSVRPIKADTSPTDSSSKGQALAKWAPEPAWPLQWTPAEIRQDELRRMCWIASSMAGHLSQFRSMTGQRPIDFYMAKPENVSLGRQRFALRLRLISILLAVCTVLYRGDLACRRQSECREEHNLGSLQQVHSALALHERRKARQSVDSG